MSGDCLRTIHIPTAGFRFKAFTYRHVTKVSEALMRLTLTWMRPVSLSHPLDLDSTVFCRYGTQEGSRKGYTSLKPGRPSQHPLLAWLSERRWVLWATLRPGQAGAANGVLRFLAQALTLLPPGHRVARVRADAGFYEMAFLEALEGQDLPYIIVSRLPRVGRRLVVPRIPDADWRGLAPGIAVADIQATFPTWRGQLRRFVCLRQTLSERPEARGRRLIEFPGYTYRVVVTSVLYPAELVTPMYAGRADSENRIKELKEDLSLDTLCLQSFEVTDAAFRTGCVLYNLLAGFRERVLPHCWCERWLRALREWVFLVGAYLIPQARAVQVRLAVPREGTSRVSPPFGDSPMG